MNNNENLPHSKTFSNSRIKILPIPKWTLKNTPKTFKIVPKWRNFAKSGHTDLYLKLLSNGPD